LHWFNPVIYWLIRDMKEIHEFQADDYTLTKGIDATKYQLLIIQKGVGPQRFALANSFNHCQIKKRIAMINKQKTNKAWSWKVATFLPLLALLLMAFGRKGESSPLGSSGLSSISQVSSNDSIRKKNPPPHAPPPILAILPVDVNKNSLYVLDGNIIDKNKMETILFTGIESIYVLKDKSATDLYGEKAINGVVVITSKGNGMNANTSTGIIGQNTHLKNNDCIYVAIDQMCEFPGGEIRLRQFIAEQTKYPEDAKKDKLEGRVFVNFVVNSKGKVVNAKIARGISPSLDAEAIRVISSLPDWKPGKVHGEDVNVFYTIPVQFFLQTKK
jgi:TonB family protein